MKKRTAPFVRNISLMLIVALLAMCLGACRGDKADTSNGQMDSESTEESTSETSGSIDSEFTEESTSEISLPEEDTQSVSGIPSAVQGIAYYVSSSLGDDSNTGLSEEDPWKSLDKVSEKTYEPGDHIYFKKGDHWDGIVRFHGSGVKDSPINVGSYGDGDLQPVLNGTGAETNRKLFSSDQSGISGTLEIIEGSYWHISDLEITNNKDGPAIHRAGILVVDNCKTAQEYKDGPQYGITIDKCYIHDVVSEDTEKRTGGIVILGNYNDILIDNNILENLSVSGIRNVSWSSFAYGNGEFYLKNYEVSNNILKNIEGDCIVLGSVEDGLIEYNYVDGYCSGKNPKKDYAALWTWACKDIFIQYNEVTGGGNPENDGTPFDVDYYNTNVVIQYNYTHNNQKGIAMFPINSTGTVFRHNISINDGQNGAATLFPYQITEADQAPLMYDNIIYQSSSLSSQKLLNNSTGMDQLLYVKFYNNIIISSKTLRLTKNNKITGGNMDGNIFVPSNIIDNSDNEINSEVYNGNNTVLDRDSLRFNDIKIGEEPTGLITGYDVFDVSKLNEFNGAGKIFKEGCFCDRNNYVDVEALESLGDVPRAEKDFFGNRLYDSDISES